MLSASIVTILFIALFYYIFIYDGKVETPTKQYKRNPQVIPFVDVTKPVDPPMETDQRKIETVKIEKKKFSEKEVAELAYIIAERDGFKSNPEGYWFHAVESLKKEKA